MSKKGKKVGGSNQGAGRGHGPGRAGKKKEAYNTPKPSPKTRSVIDTKESDGIDDPMEKIAIKSHSDHYDSGIGKMLILIDAYFVISLQCNKMTK